MSITIQDIADRAGIHPGTVSRALNGDPRVRETTRTRILEAASALGYVMNRNAKNLAAGRTKMVCLAVPSLSCEQVSEAVDRMNRYLAEHGYTLMILVHNNSRDQFRKCLQDFTQKLCDAAVLFAPQNEFRDFPEFKLLSANKFPMLCMDQWLPDMPIPAVTNDAEESIRLLTGKMLGAGMDGALVYFPASNTVAQTRHSAACRLLKQTGLPFTDDVVKLAGLLKRNKIKTLGIFGDSPYGIPELSGLKLPYIPKHCIGGMFDSWKYNAPSFFEHIFLCIQDNAQAGEFAADAILKALSGDSLFEGIRKIPPLKIISPL